MESPGFSQSSFTLMCPRPGDKRKFAELLGILCKFRVGDWNPVEQSMEGLSSLSTHRISLTGTGISDPLPFTGNKNTVLLVSVHGMLVLH